MIEREVYSPKEFLQILQKNGVDCTFERCGLYKDYATYHFSLQNDKQLSEFQIYSVTFSVIVESESSCYFVGKKGKQLIFLLTFTNDLAKYGLKKTPETLGKIPKENLAFEFVKMPLKHIVWYKFDTKKLLTGEFETAKLKEFTDSATNAEERVLLDEIWNNLNS